MVIPMVQHDRADHADSRLGPNLRSVPQKAPTLVCLLVGEPFEVFRGIAAALFVRRENLLEALWLWRHETALGNVETRLLRDPRYTPRYGRNVPGQLSEGHGLGMWLPGQFVARNPVQNPPGRGALIAELLEHRRRQCVRNDCFHVGFS